MDDENTNVKELTENERKVNRQINFFIIRYMWQVIRGRGRYTVYDDLDIKRQRYTRIIDYGTLSLKKSQYDLLCKKTGIPIDIFTGNSRFNVKGIKNEDWERFANLRTGGYTSKSEGYDGKDISIYDEYNNLQKKICNTLDKYENIEEAVTDESFYKLCYYLEKKRPKPSSEDTATTVQMAVEIGKRLTISELGKYNISDLEKINKIFTNRKKLLDAFIVCERARKNK